MLFPQDDYNFYDCYDLEILDMVKDKLRKIRLRKKGAEYGVQSFESVAEKFFLSFSHLYFKNCFVIVISETY